MHDLPADWGALCALVVLLGLKHGFDADHLATINGLTRFNAQAGRAFARWCGALFSLGHGAVVMLIALAVGLARERWTTPVWLDLTGAWVSIGFLIALGVINLHAVLASAPGALVLPVGLKGRFLGRFARAGHPLAVAAVGALFALSFDTVSQSALFALAGVHFGGTANSLVLGALFLAGMLVTDALNGLWISRLLARADALAATASRLMGLAIGGVSLLVAAFGVARLALGPVDAPEWMQGAVVVGVIGSSYIVAQRLARGPRTAPA
jgi:nickel/cobalt transporter (NiCoT) family protein